MTKKKSYIEKLQERGRKVGKTDRERKRKMELRKVLGKK